MLAIVVVVWGLAGGLYLYGHETLNAIAAHSPAVKKAQKLTRPDRAPRREPAIGLIAATTAGAAPTPPTSPARAPTR